MHQVPRSTKLIYEDKDYCLFSVTLFKRVADSFKAAARTKGFQVCSWFSRVLTSVVCTTLLRVTSSMSTLYPGHVASFLGLCAVVLVQVRDYEFDQELQQTGATDSVKTAADAKRSQLEQWSATA